MNEKVFEKIAKELASKQAQKSYRCKSAEYDSGYTYAMIDFENNAMAIRVDGKSNNLNYDFNNACIKKAWDYHFENISSKSYQLPTKKDLTRFEKGLKEKYGKDFKKFNLIKVSENVYVQESLLKKAYAYLGEVSECKICDKGIKYPSIILQKDNAEILIMPVRVADKDLQDKIYKEIMES